MKIQKENIKNILLIKLCCLGDIIFFTPVIENLRLNFPDAKLTLICSTWLKNIVPLINNIDEVIYYEGPYEKKPIKRLSSTINAISKLRKNKYDLAIVGHRNNFYGLFAFLSGVKYRLGYTGTKYLTHTTDFDSQVHIVDKNIALLNPLNIKIAKRSPVLKKIKSSASDKKIIGIFPFGGVNPGTNMAIKRWDLENYFKVISKVSSEYSIILFEGREPSEILPQEYKSSDNVSLKTMSNEDLSLCDVFISGDTGPLHIAAAMGINTVSLFGPTDPELLKPLSSEENQNIVIWKKPYCSPCYTPVTAADRSNPKYWRGNTFICHTGTHICMKSISVEEVVSSINTINKLNISKNK